jgi:hypothetical protein
LYSVTLHVDTKEYTIGVSNPKTGELIGLEQYERIENSKASENNFILQSDHILKILNDSSQTTLYITSSKFTIVPSIFYDIKHINEFHHNLFELSAQETIFSKFIPEIDSYIIFSVESQLKNSLQTQIGHIDFNHHFASLISTYYLYYTTESENSAFIQFHSNTFSLCLFEGKKMKLFNVFEFNSSEDIIYYTYYSMEQFNFSTVDTIVHVGGRCTYKEEVLSTLQRFTSKIFNLKPDHLTQLNQVNSDALINTIFDLQCG